MTGTTVELEVRGLTKRFSPQVTVGPLSFEVMEGEFFSLLGPSGCGKTTTLRCIAGFEEPSAGSILLGGQRLEALELGTAARHQDGEIAVTLPPDTCWAYRDEGAAALD